MSLADIRPWSQGRTAYVDSVIHEHVERDNRVSGHPTLAELATRTDLLAAAVTPVWETNSGRGAEEIAGKVMELAQSINEAPNLGSSIRLYQILFTDYYTHFGAWTIIGRSWDESALAHSDFMFDLFMDWFEHAPEEKVADSALFFLSRTKKKPPLDSLMRVAHDYRLSVGVGALVKRQYNADEDVLISIAKMHHYSVREIILSYLETVKRTENIEWLLTEGYDSKAFYHPCGYYAAVHGDLLTLLRAPRVAPERLVHFANILGDMCQASGGSPSWKTIEDYPDAMEAIALFYEHVRQNKQSVTLASQLSDTLYYLQAHTGDEDDELVFDRVELTRLYEIGQAFFVEPSFSKEERLRYLYWERPEPTLDDLEIYGVEKFYDLLELSKDQENESLLRGVVDWVHDYLKLDAVPDVREARKKELLANRMPGVCSGGIAGLQDPDLSSIYGQLLLQTAQALQGAVKPIGAQLLLAGLKTDYPHLPKAAADVFLSWADQSEIPEEARLMLVPYTEVKS